MTICILNFLKTGAFGERIPLGFNELTVMYGPPNEIFSRGKMFLDFDGIDESASESFPVVAGYEDIQFHFHYDTPNLVVCNYSYNNLPESSQFTLRNASLLKGNMRLAKFLEKMAKHNIDIADISLTLDQITKTRFISLNTEGGVEVNFCHEHGARDFRLCQFVKSNESRSS